MPTKKKKKIVAKKKTKAPAKKKKIAKKVKLSSKSLKSKVSKKAKADGVKPVDDPGGWSDTAHDDVKTVTGQDHKDT